MGKTVQRQRRREAAAAAAAPPVKKPPLKRSAATGRVSAALDARRWEAALTALQEMREAGLTPRLGAVQRWVRAADTCGQEARAARLLAAIVRAAETGKRGGANSAKRKLPVSIGEPPGTIRRFADWYPPGSVTVAAPTTPDEADGAVAKAAAGVRAAVEPAAGQAATSAGGGSAASPPEERGGQELAPVAAGTAAAPAADPAAAAAAVGEAAGEVHPAVMANGCAERSTDGAATAATPQAFPAAGHTQPSPRFWPLRLAAPAAPSAGSPPRLFAVSPDVLRLDPRPPTSVTRHDVPFVPGAFMLIGVLTRDESGLLIRLAEEMKLREDVDYASGALGAAAVAAISSSGAAPDAAAAASSSAPRAPHSGGAGGGSSGGRVESAARTSAGGERAAGVVLMADPAAVVEPLLSRCSPHLPPVLAGGALAGINPRFRVYRYRPGGVYRPHVDGAWPGSAVRGDEVIHDAYDGACWSRLTLVLYLNDGFGGGATTFFGAAPDADGVLEARGVRPVQGAALVFPHGDAGCLVHEGSAVTEGVKYIIRTDVLYTNAPARHHDGVAAGLPAMPHAS